MKTKTLYGCVIKHPGKDNRWAVIGPLEDKPDRIKETCEALQPENGLTIYHVAKIEVEIPNG